MWWHHDVNTKGWALINSRNLTNTPARQVRDLPAKTKLHGSLGSKKCVNSSLLKDRRTSQSERTIHTNQPARTIQFDGILVRSASRFTDYWQSLVISTTFHFHWNNLETNTTPDGVIQNRDLIQNTPKGERPIQFNHLSTKFNDIRME
jgi:hypothetical protein